VKKIVALVMVVSMFCTIGGNYTYAADLELNGIAFVLMDAKSGEILYEKNSHQEHIPASVTKLMTLLLALEQLEKGTIHKDDIVTTSQYASSMGGSQIYLAQGEQLTLEEMMISVAVASANDAAVAIGEYIAGSCDEFVVMMNKKAKELGMHHTHFANPNGLPMENHYTTAYDLALLARELITNYPQILEYTAIKTYTIRKNTKPFVMTNTNKLLWWYDGVDGLKTGWIGEASGYNVVSTVMKDHMRLIAVVLGAPKVYENFYDTMKIYDWAYENYTYKEFYHAGSMITKAQISKCTNRSLAVTAEEDIAITIEKDQAEKVNTQILINDLKAPIKEGDNVGQINISIDGEIVQSFPLVAMEERQRYGYLDCFKILASIFFGCKI